MATSLVSTGVQFPDNSIQTTAATGGTMQFIASVSTNNTNVSEFSFTNTISSTYKHYRLVFTHYRWSGNGANPGIEFQKSDGTWVTIGYTTYSKTNYFNSAQADSLLERNTNGGYYVGIYLPPGAESTNGWVSGYLDLIGVNDTPPFPSNTFSRAIGHFSGGSEIGRWHQTFSTYPSASDTTGFRIRGYASGGFNSYINNGRVDLYGIKTS